MKFIGAIAVEDYLRYAERFGLENREAITEQARKDGKPMTRAQQRAHMERLKARLEPPK